MSPRPLNLAVILEAMADAVPTRNALVTIDREYTYAEIDERATRLANHLVSLGVAPGDHVAVHSANRIEWIDALYGCMKAGAAPINVNYKYLHDELAHVYQNADCVAAIVAPEHVAALDALDLPALRHRIVIGREYDAALAAASTTRIHRPLGRRPLRPLHRWHHRLSQGRDLEARGPHQGRAQRRPVRRTDGVGRATRRRGRRQRDPMVMLAAGP